MIDAFDDLAALTLERSQVHQRFLHILLYFLLQANPSSRDKLKQQVLGERRRSPAVAAPQQLGYDGREVLLRANPAAASYVLDYSSKEKFRPCRHISPLRCRRGVLEMRVMRILQVESSSSNCSRVLAPGAPNPSTYLQPRMQGKRELLDRRWCSQPQQEPGEHGGDVLETNPAASSYVLDYNWKQRQWLRLRASSKILDPAQIHLPHLRVPFGVVRVGVQHVFIHKPPGARLLPVLAPAHKLQRRLCLIRQPPPASTIALRALLPLHQSFPASPSTLTLPAWARRR